MPDFHGPIQHVAIARTLWLILAFPVAAMLAIAVYGGWRAFTHPAGSRRVPPDARARRLIASVSIAGIAAAFAVSVCHAWLLSTKPADERFLLEHLWRMVRVGQLDASFDLALDPLSSTMTLVVAGIGLPIFVFAAAYMKDDPAYARFFAWLNGFVAAMLLLVLADNFVLLLFGWEGVGLCSWGLVGFWWQAGAKATAGRKAFLVNRVGDAGLILGIALLYWGLGGAWQEGDYVPDLGARFSSVEVGPARADELAEDQGTREENGEPEADDAHGPQMPSTTGEGYLTLTSYSGAAVFMDDARAPLERAPGEFLRAPFVRFPVKGGLHSFRIHPGSGLEDSLVSHVAFGGGREIALASFGPSVTFRNVRDQLVAHDAHGHAPVREALVTKRAWGKTTVLTLACLLLFVGAIGKSAQFPLYVWLPDAMAGPTPVSALIHAATMVTAGVYLVVRLAFLFVLSSQACTVIAVVGAGTAFFAATMGLYQYDLKRILAYSTVSQLGLMVLAVGVGAYAAGMFHLVTHACFKACLFLSAGAVAHAVHHLEQGEHGERRAQDVRRLGGLKRVLPKTSRAYFIACLAITSAPIPGLAGFWSKDDILVRTFTAQGLVGVSGPALGVVALLAAGVTSFYMWRSWYLVFEGEPHGPIEGAHDGPPAMTGALAVLAGLSVLAGLVGVSARLVGGSGESLLEGWLAPALRDANAPFARGGLAADWGIIAAAYAVALGGWALARARYGETRAKDWAAEEHRVPLFVASTHGWWLDAIYTRVFRAVTVHTSAFLAEFDDRVIDGLVHAGAIGTRAVGWIVGRADDGLVDGAVRGLSEGTLRVGRRLQRVQSGRVQTYVLFIVLGVMALAFIPYWLR